MVRALELPSYSEDGRVRTLYVLETLFSINVDRVVQWLATLLLLSLYEQAEYGEKDSY